jgi:hypothetical protein
VTVAIIIVVVATVILGLLLFDIVVVVVATAAGFNFNVLMSWFLCSFMSCRTNSVAIYSDSIDSSLCLRFIVQIHIPMFCTYYSGYIPLFNKKIGSEDEG